MSDMPPISRANLASAEIVCAAAVGLSDLGWLTFGRSASPPAYEETPR
jgi:hypothetical protein